MRTLRRPLDLPVSDTVKITTVANIMSRPVVTATADEKIAEAAAHMGESRVGPNVDAVAAFSQA